jgi:large-conductance mechanosensitive channel
MITITDITMTTTTIMMTILTTMTDTWDMDTTTVDSWANAIQHVMETVMDHGPLIVALVEIMLTGTQINTAVDVTTDGTDMTVVTAMLP